MHTCETLFRRSQKRKVHHRLAASGLPRRTGVQCALGVARALLVGEYVAVNRVGAVMLAF